LKKCNGLTDYQVSLLEQVSLNFIQMMSLTTRIQKTSGVQLKKGLLKVIWVAAVFGEIWGSGWVHAKQDSASLNLPTVLLAELPLEARQTFALIQAGGPFAYEKDGVIFFNRERILPAKPRGRYREYTVPTPGLKHRGARRLVCEVASQTVIDPCYYTADHYRSFKRVLP